MNKRERAEAFGRLVGLELKGKIVSKGFTAQAVAKTIGRSPAAFNRWLNGKVEIPLAVLCEACEVIDVEPSTIVDDAYARLAVAYGERGGYVHEDAAAARAEVERDLAGVAPTTVRHLRPVGASIDYVADDELAGLADAADDAGGLSHEDEDEQREEQP